MNTASKFEPKRKFLSQPARPMKEFPMSNAGLVQRLPKLSKRSLL